MTYKLTQGWPQNVETGSFVNPDTNTEYLAWLAEGNTPRPADAPVCDIQAEIDTLERQQMLPRITREFMLTSMEALLTAEQLAANVGYRKAKEFDGQVRALRGLL